MKKLFFILLLFSRIVSYGQDFGPRTFPFAPKGITTLNLTYVDLHSNVTPSKDVILANGIVDVDALVMPIVHTFAIAGHLSQVFISPAVGRIGGFVDIDNKQFEIVDVNGLLDANVMLRVGLLNTPVLDREDFVKSELKFQLSGLVSISVPIGQYDQKRRVNLGSNRWAFKLGMPMILPLNKNKKKIFLWEIIPSVTFFTQNTKPFNGDVKTQNSLFWIEQHLSKNFTERFWASINLDYQYGGKTFIDGSSLDNVINQLGAGVTLAYSPFSGIPLTFHSTYSKTWFNNTSGYLFLIGTNLQIP